MSDKNYKNKYRNVKEKLEKWIKAAKNLDEENKELYEYKEKNDRLQREIKDLNKRLRELENGKDSTTLSSERDLLLKDGKIQQLQESYKDLQERYKELKEDYREQSRFMRDKFKEN